MLSKFAVLVSPLFIDYYGGVENACPLAWRVHLIRHQLAQFPGVAMFRLAPERGEMGYSGGLGHGPPFYLARYNSASPRLLSTRPDLFSR